MIPGRTQSKCVSGKRRSAAEFARLRGASIRAVTASKRCSGSAMPDGPSASAKCVISVIPLTTGERASRSNTFRYSPGAKPSRFIPEFSLRYTGTRVGSRTASSSAICSGSWTTIERPCSPTAWRSSASNTPSRSRIGFATPASRRPTASFRSRSA